MCLYNHNDAWRALSSKKLYTLGPCGSRPVFAAGRPVFFVMLHELGRLWAGFDEKLYNTRPKVYNSMDSVAQNGGACPRGGLGAARLYSFEGGHTMISYFNTYGKVSMTGNYFAELVSAAAQSGFGVAGMATKGTTEHLRNLITPDFPEKGVRVRETGGKLHIELHIKVIFGLNVTEAVKSISHKVRYVVEEATGLKVGRIDVRVDDVVA